MRAGDKIFVAGHRGLVGSAITRRLRRLEYDNLLLAGREDLDLTRQERVDEFFDRERPDYVFLAAAKVGGIHANDTYPAEFIQNNLAIQTNVIDAAYRHGTCKLLFLGSSCIYPKEAPQPMREEYLLSGKLEPTNEWYAIAKIAGLKMCQAYRRQYGFDAIAVMPTNLYGPGDNFNANNSHVIPGLIRKFHLAKATSSDKVTIWGTGEPRREFMHVDDLADACLFLMQKYSGEQFVNVGTGQEFKVIDLAQLIAETVGYSGKILCDHGKPDGTMRKLLDVSRLDDLGWKPAIDLASGLADTYRWFLDNESSLRD